VALAHQNGSPLHSVTQVYIVQVLDAVMRYSDRNVGEEAEQAGQQVEVLHWAAAIDDTGQYSQLLQSQDATLSAGS